MTEPQTPILFLDFDGTISRRDAVDAILETYADPKWLTFEAEWSAGRIGSRDCLRAQMSSCGRRESRSMHYWTR